MHGLIRRVVVAGGAAVALLVSAAGAASASGSPALNWTPATSPGTYSYGSLAAGQTASQVFTLTNSGGSASSALKISLTGSAAFTITADTCTATSLGPKKSCYVTVSYAPATPGQADTATLTAASNKAATASLTLTGAAAKASPTITTSAPTPALAGTTMQDTATLAGGFNPGGKIIFNLYPTSDCSGSPVDTETAAASGDGPYTTPTGYTPPGPGTYEWTASYGGDGANNAAASGCGQEPVTVSTCLVTDTSSNQGYTTLQDAVNAAAAGDTLTVEGTCTGTTTIGQDLTVTGQPASGYPTPTLNGNHSGTVLTIDSGATVTVNALTITGGLASGCCGGGIWSNSTVTLNNDTVTGNTTTSGTGGGGIGNLGGSLTLNSTSVTDNTASGGGGGGIWSNGTVTLNGSSSITGNSAFQGGGIFGAFAGTVTLNDTARISGNTSSDVGGGIAAYDMVLTMTGNASITGNSAGSHGGGIGYFNSTLIGATAGTGGNVYDNTPDDISSI